jgi:hypothetical protein
VAFKRKAFAKFARRKIWEARYLQQLVHQRGKGDRIDLPFTAKSGHHEGTVARLERRGLRDRKGAGRDEIDYDRDPVVAANEDADREGAANR